MRRRAAIVLGVLTLAMIAAGVSRLALSTSPGEVDDNDNVHVPRGELASRENDESSGDTNGQDRISSDSGDPSQGRDPHAELGFPPDFVFGSYLRPYDDLRPADCSLERGKPCVIVFQGTFRLVSEDKALVRISAIEDTSPEPVASIDVPITRGRGRFFERLAYTPSDQASKVQFRVLLVSTDGRLMFERQPPEPYLPLYG